MNRPDPELFDPVTRPVTRSIANNNNNINTHRLAYFARP